MHIQDPQQQQLIGAQAHALQQRKEALNKAIEALNTRRDNIGKRLATAEALQAEALTLRQNARQSLRDMIGIPGKPTREAKEKELAAQSLSEEMLLIAEEETLLAEQEHEQLWKAKGEIQAESDIVMAQYCQALLDEQMQLLKQQMPVLALLFDIAPQQFIDQLIGKAAFKTNPFTGDVEISQPAGLLEKTLREAQTAEKDEVLTLLLSPINLGKPATLSTNSQIATTRAIEKRNEQLNSMLNRE